MFRCFVISMFRCFDLIIINGVRAGLCDFRAHTRAFTPNDVAENLKSVLLTLVVTNDADLNLLFVAEILVVMHLAREKGVSTLTQGVWQQEVTSTATECHLTDGTLQQLVTHGTLHVELALHQFHKVLCSHHPWQFTNDATTRLQAVHHLLGKETAACQPQSLSHLPVDAILCIVHIGMHRDNHYVVLDGLDDTTLHVVLTTDLLQTTEQQGVVADNEVTALTNGLVNNLLVDVQTQ